MSWQSDFYGNVYSTAKELGATDTQAHLAAAQASQETGYGQHVVGNNYFGVKASPSYTGDTVTANTSEGEDAVSNRMDQSFRAYDGLKASVANYMDVMANAFPDAWNATNIAEAAKGLVSGKFGRYAKDLNYTGKVQSIANKYGAQQKYAYAQEPENVPVPYGPEDDPLANSQQAQAIDGLSGVVNPVSAQEVSSSELAAPEGWTINGVAPALGPTVEGWSAMAAADPMAITPSYNVPASASLGANPGLLASAMANPIVPSQATAAAPQDGFSELASAGPFGGEFASPQARMGLATPGISQADVNRALTGPADGMDPSFTAGLMSPNNPVVPTAVETTSYTPGAAPSALGSFPEAMAAQRMPATGIYSPEHLAVQAQAERQLAATRAMQPSMNIPATASIATNPALEASAIANQQPAAGALSTAMATPNFSQALNPSIPGLSVPGINAYAAQPSVTPAEAAVNSVATPGLSPSQISGYTDFAASALPGGITNLSGNTLVGPAGTATANFAAPALDTVQVAEQPTIASPTTTPAVTQQAEQQVQSVANTQAQPTTQNKGMLSGIINPGTAMGSIAGSLAAGPLGGIIGAIIGNQIAKNGLPSSSDTTMSGGYLGTGPSAAYGVYGGAPAGSYATASDGSTVTAQGDGDVTRTNTYGVTDVANSYGGYAGYFGGNPPDSNKDNGGYSSPGLF